MAYLYVAIGSALGGMVRYGCGRWMAGWTWGSLPWGTITVNAAGSALIGVLLALSQRGEGWFGTLEARNFLMVGLLGGFTTFSAFSLQTFELMRAQQWGAAGANLLLSVFLCMAAVAIGYWLAASAA